MSDFLGVLDQLKTVCLVDSSSGIYIPEHACRLLDHESWHLGLEDVEACLRGPEDPKYWDAWSDILDYAFYIDDDGNTWQLRHDGDLFAVLAD